MSSEPNNLISEVADSGVDFATEKSVTFSGTIDKVSDVDLYQFELDQGQGVTLDVDTVESGNNQGGFDSFLRVFDSLGNELTFNDDSAVDSAEFSLDPYTGFIANESGQYYVGISSTANQSYDPTNGEDVNEFADNFSGGDYDLTIELLDVVADEDPDSTISEATTIALDPQTQMAIIEEEIATEADVDFYRVELAAEEGVNLSVSAVEDEEFNSYLRFFDADGNELAFNDNSSDPDNVTTDSAIAFAPQEGGEYFIGVSSAGNFDYDEINGDTNLNFSTNTGVSKGKYELEVAVAEVVADDDPDNTIDSAIASEVGKDNNSSASFADEIDSELDVDLYQLVIGEGEGVNLNISTDESDSDLDSLIRFFDADGNELAVDDNDDANFTGSFDADSSLSLIPDAPGTYYAAVSASGNADYDPVEGRTNFSQNVVSPFTTVGAYELDIEVLAVETDSDPDNTLSEAIDSGASSQGTREILLSGEIEVASDADIYQLQLDAGDGVTVDLDTANVNFEDFELDSYLRLFDGSGNELAFDNDDDNNVAETSGTDSLITFAPEDSGEYFIGVSSSGNAEYDVVNGSNNFTPSTGTSSGSYDLEIKIAPVIADTDPNNTITEAIASNLSSTGEITATFTDSIESAADLDIYQVQLSSGDTVSLDIDTTGEDRLDTVIKIFNAAGNELGFNDDGLAPGEDSNLDSYTEFTAATTGEYYVGVSSYGNFDYDPINGSNNFSYDVGSTTGDYSITLNILDVVPS